MRRELITAVFLLTSGVVMAEEKSVTLKLSQPLELFGGFSTGYFYTTNEGNKDSQDTFQITNAIVGLKGETGENIKIGLDLAVGYVYEGTVFSPIKNTARDIYTRLLWGYATLKPHSLVTIDAGILTTNVGYEVIDTYSNPNVLLGAIWNAQPVTYPGARITITPTKSLSVYAEYNQESAGQDNYAAGVSGNVAGIDYAVNYYDSSKNIVDVVLGYSVGMVDIGLNTDYQWHDNPATGQDKSAYGLALYLIPKLDNLSIPVRLEYFKSGTSGIYGDSKGYTVTITPTFRPAKNAFVRTEVAYVKTDNKIFKGSGNNKKDSKTTLTLEIGFTF